MTNSSDPLPQSAGAEVQRWYAALEAKALRLLTRREQSAHELMQRLKEAGQPRWGRPGLSAPEFLHQDELSCHLAQLIFQLQFQGWQSDLRFAASLTERLLRQGKGPLLLQQAFAQHQLATDLTQPHLARLAPLWLHQAQRVRRQKFGHELPVDRRQAAKMQRFLASRGFTAEQIYAAVFEPENPV
ncbi:regulatory protein RecX [Marinospirillum sp. MEB164]|uniref:Regulatory protein RecX n=1 Tax=Marinospirillum alkalitolerans TaxID=3123374 RepID=A0ABW8PZQ0_9GAMM